MRGRIPDADELKAGKQNIAPDDIKKRTRHHAFLLAHEPVADNNID
jgi:hypothetical protein